MEKIETNVVKPETNFFENEVTNSILNPQEESILDSRIKELRDFMSTNSGKGKSESEKDVLYKDAQNLWFNFVNALKETKYNFYLNRPQYRFITDLLLSKIELDVNTVFFAIELTETLLNMKNVKHTNDTDIIAIPVNATEITYIYHLISTHKVKGLTKDAYTFAKILYRIGSISKIFNYYETASKNLSEDIKDWVLTFEYGVDFEKRDEPTVDANVIEPKQD